ncbi:type II secretion system secretin GspD [Ottowia sp.]|uniref:type II secretion system secretin GspD n=1 Tax=Ottowia sp. TaxID=1898956 RepID=UPI002C384280|nr:type II secretion system secretin GspD [Ottowia sp.]HOB65264.1 type II secretion system secretin GspD [Ottowia sp.]HPZ56174.1 type II secretion system secretin GspD [Ottowia sp.]HQD48294.1 type II secretion system secretin GspD [Ottowia sp.]
MPRAFCITPPPRAARTALAVLLALATALPLAPAMAQSAASGGGNVTLDFANAEIDAVARTMATITGRNVVVDPRVKGTMTLTSTTPVSPAQALRLFGAQLRTQGFALLESSGMVLVLPESDAKLQASSVSAGAVRGGGQVQTQIFRLTHENANNLVPVLRPLISPNNTINVNPGTNALVITDYGDNLQRLARIIAALDVSNATGVEVVRLRHAVASDLAPLVARLIDSGAGGAPATAAPGQPAMPVAAALGGGDSGYRTTLVPEPRSNAIIVRAANPARLALAKTLIQQLDQPPQVRADGSTGNIHVVYLKNADAAKLAVTLRAALAALPGQTPSAGAVGGTGSAIPSSPAGINQMLAGAQMGGTAGGLATGPSINAAANNQPATGGQIQADPATNSLIISAAEPVYRELRAVIDRLDQRRAQVYVESLIAEVSMSKAADLGVQWQQLLGNGRNTIGVLGTNYSSGRATSPMTPNTNIFDVAGAVTNYVNNNTVSSLLAAKPNTGFNFALGTRNLMLLANFIQTSGAGNVLSTPTLLTLDNEEAKIMVGQNVPMPTGSFTNTGASGGTVNPFQTYERKDVGLTLRVRPQINENGTVKMVIYQETSSVDPATAASLSGPTTNKRAIESSVLVDDGAVVVLGGLMEDQFSEGEDKVPLLGDVPVLGNLFKNRNRKLIKTNLMVFLRPVIVRDAAATEAFSLDRYDYMRAAQQANQPQPSAAMPVNEAPVMPPLVPANPEAWTRPAPPPPLRGQHGMSSGPAAGEGNYYGGTTFRTP